MPDSTIPHHHVAIIGTGFGGIATAIRLQQDGFHDFVLLECANDIGGVWRDNDYPGAAVDVQCQLYSFSFAPNPHWRNFMSDTIFRHASIRNGFEILEQKTISWGTAEGIDCITVMRRK